MKVSNILFFISLLPVSGRSGCVFREGMKGHWGECCSSGSLKDLLIMAWTPWERWFSAYRDCGAGL